PLIRPTPELQPATCGNLRLMLHQTKAKPLKLDLLVQMTTSSTTNISSIAFNIKISKSIQCVK
ncbi:19293_t:CDS:1, partial [Gigaspora rosea]